MIKGPLKAPISLQVELTDNCNHLCRHCYNFARYTENGNIIVSKPINMGDLESITQNIIRNEVFHVTLSGGEPTLLGTQRLEKIIGTYREHEVQVTVNSNLSLLPNDMADLFKKYNIKVLTSVVHHSPEVFARIVNNKQAYTHLMRNVGKLAVRGVRVAANMVVTKETVGDVYDTGNFAVSIGCSSFNATRISPSNASGAEIHRQLVLDNGDVLNMLEQLHRLTNERNIPVGTLNALPYCAVPEPNKFRYILERSCVAGLTSAGIGANGDVRGCQHLPITYGNLLREELIDVWSKVPAWKLEFKNEHCRGCAVIHRCGGGCRENSLVTGGSMTAEDSLIRNGSGKIKENWDAPKPKIPSPIQLKKRLLTRKEEFGGIFYKNPSNYALLDAFSYMVLPHFYGSPIRPQDILEAGKDLVYVTQEYINKLFTNLIHKGVAETLTSAGDENHGKS